MRLIGRVKKEDQARLFSNYLKKQDIENLVEIDSEKQEALIWIEDEDQIEEAQKLMEEFQANPDEKKFQINAASSEKTKPESLIGKVPSISIKPVKRRNKHLLTMFFLVVCFFIYFINFAQEFKISKKGQTPLLSPIQLVLLYDVPQALVEFVQFLQDHPIDPTSTLEELPLQVQQKIKEIEQIPQWRGLYVNILNKLQNKEVPTGPMFIKIRQGQVWRVFTPTILHKDLLHILFNMLWLWVLGRQIEEKISRLKMLIMIVVIAVISNTCQYLVSGPLFLGFSGVIVGMAGFIWMRQRHAAWEGYNLHKSTFLFLGIFVLAMLGLQILSFVVQIFGSDFLTINIANTAHISGGLVGMFLGRGSLFSWRPLER